MGGGWAKKMSIQERSGMLRGKVWSVVLLLIFIAPSFVYSGSDKVNEQEEELREVFYALRGGEFEGSLNIYEVEADFRAFVALYVQIRTESWFMAAVKKEGNIPSIPISVNFDHYDKIMAEVYGLSSDKEEREFRKVFFWLCAFFESSGQDTEKLLGLLYDVRSGRFGNSGF